MKGDNIMTIIKKDGYVFDVDIKKTADYYKSHSLCECEYCKNFYEQIKGKFSKLEAFLSDFGIDISKPDEMSPLESDDIIEYLSVDYTVCGKVATMGHHEIHIHDNQLLSLIITDGFVSPNEQTADYFTISVHNIELPWILDRPFKEPTKTNRIKRIFKKIFKA